MSYGSGQYGSSPYGGEASAKYFAGRARCAPITPGTLEVNFVPDVGTPFVLARDDENGGLVSAVEFLALYPDGSVTGGVDYRTGIISSGVIASGPWTSGPGTVTLTYLSQEGGCAGSGCGGCKTHKFRLVVVPGTNIGENQIAVTEAFSRLAKKIESITPIHATWEPLNIVESMEIQIVEHYDLTPADVQQTDTSGLYLIWT